MPDPASDPRRTYFGVQALRAVAALFVVGYHATLIPDESHAPLVGGVWSNGACGVDIFFVISGFVMAVTAPGLAGRADGGRVFLWRRLVRIVPLYWLFTTAAWAWRGFGLGPGAGGAWRVAASYLFIPSFDRNHQPVPLLQVGWTLHFEMMFYLLFAAALALGTPPLRFLPPILGALAVVGWREHPTWPAWTTLASPLVLEFLFGVGIAPLARRGRLPGGWVGALLLAGGFAAVCRLPMVDSARVVYWGLPAAAIVAGAVGLEDAVGRRLPRWLLEAGNASYAVYLVHPPVVAALWPLLARHGGTGRRLAAEMIVLSLVLCLGAGEAVHRLIELPLMRLLRGRRVRGVSVLPA